MKQKIFQDFAAVSKQGWIAQAIKDLKGADFEQQLVSTAMEGFRIDPYYAVEDTGNTKWIKAFDNKINPATEMPGLPPRQWVNAVEITGTNETAAHQEIHSVLNNGADGLIFPLSKPWDWDRALAGVVLSSVAIWIKPMGENPLPVIDAFSSWLERQVLKTSELQGGILWDGLRLGFDRPIHLEKQIQVIASIHQLFLSYPHFKSICLDSSIYTNAGGTAVQELGYGSAALVELWDGLTEKGIRPEALFSDLLILTAVGSDYFVEIAKLKTFRIVLHQLAKLYQVDLSAEEIQLFASTSHWSKSLNEPINNLLRNTTEAMAAIIGGSNVLFVAPHDQGSDAPQAFSKRMARNISTILKEESYFDKTVDPAAGSYLMENLIQSLYEEGIALLKKVEAEGGWWKNYTSHQIQKEVKAIRDVKFQRLITGEIKKIGITQHLPDAASSNFSEEDYQLKASSHSLPYEQKL